MDAQEQAKWADIIQANPALNNATFADDVAKWNALKEAADKAGLTTDEAVRFIATGMTNTL